MRPLDATLLRQGLRVTVPDLIAVFHRHHHNGRAACPHCGHRYTTTAPYCPSETLARTLLKQRRGEHPQAYKTVKDALTAADTRVLPNPDPDPAPPTTAEMFPIDPTWRTTTAQPAPSHRARAARHARH